MDIKLPTWSQELWRPHRWKVAYGGRGSAKSWTVAIVLILMACDHFERILCARELQNSISESVHALLSQTIEMLGLTDQFVVKDAYISCPRTGSEFIFSGIRQNVTKIKSMEGITKCWVEEAEKVSKKSWDVLEPTIRTPGSEIWVTFNPDEETDPTYVMLVKNPPPDAYVVEVNWRDNPWFPEVLRKAMAHKFATDPEAAEHIWNGKCNTRSKAAIFGDKYVVEEFEPHETWNGPYFGQDWGYGADPSATIKCWIADIPDDHLPPEMRGLELQDLYIEYEAFGHKVGNNELPALICSVPGADKHVIRADCSRPETIAHVAGFGLNIVAAKKWPGSVEDGIQFLRSFRRIVIHSRCVHMEEEARLYKYKEDPITGDVLAVIIDKNNHGWDAVRYALEPAISNLVEEIVAVGEDVQISPDLDEEELAVGMGEDW